MDSRRVLYIWGLMIVVVIFLGFSDSLLNYENHPDRVKVALRNVGHQLLLKNLDSVSLVLPIKEIEQNKFQISFQHKLSIEPSELTSIIDRNFKSVSLSTDYLVEVILCNKEEVAYSFISRKSRDESILPCKGRRLGEDCYMIEVKFLSNESNSYLRLILILMFLISLVILLLKYYKKNTNAMESLPEEVGKSKTIENLPVSFGKFLFYADQNKLVFEEKEISLSRKECELLTIFVSNINHIVKREDLVKWVWEDNGVIVGRSLDTYISRLRKKIQNDSTLKLSNVHGIGYKLEENI